MSEQQREDVVFWRAFGEALTSAVPLIEALRAAAGRLRSDSGLRKAAEEAAHRVETGETLSHAMQNTPEQFPSQVTSAVGSAEQAGMLDEMTIRIAEALEAGNLEALGVAGAAPKRDKEATEFVNRLVMDALASRASDIHFDAQQDGAGLIRFRIDGVLQETPSPPAGLFPRLVARIKQMSALDVTEQRLPQDGRIFLRVDGKDLDLRISTVPSLFGERLCARILDRTRIALDLNKFGIATDDLAKIRSLESLPSGMVIVNGPAGSGKTTTLYAMLNELNNGKLCIITIEDPVEYAFAGMAQIQVRPSVGLTYARAGRSVLRQDPDVIMVGELRDLETMNVTAQMALTGHLVLTTLHADTSVGAIRRLLEVGLPAFLINAALGGVISQRLARVLCPDCKQPTDVPAYLLPKEGQDFLASRTDAQFYEAKGCSACHGTGYRGRAALNEILVMDNRLRRCLAEGADMDALRDAARNAGMKTMLECGLEKAAAGVTSVQEVVRAVPHETVW
jgi:general secretion pathway protein E